MNEISEKNVPISLGGQKFDLLPSYLTPALKKKSQRVPKKGDRSQFFASNSPCPVRATDRVSGASPLPFGRKGETLVKIRSNLSQIRSRNSRHSKVISPDPPGQFSIFLDCPDCRTMFHRMWKHSNFTL